MLVVSLFRASKVQVFCGTAVEYSTTTLATILSINICFQKITWSIDCKKYYTVTYKYPISNRISRWWHPCLRSWQNRPESRWYRARCRSAQGSEAIDRVETFTTEGTNVVDSEIDVAGTFTGTRPDLAVTDALWKMDIKTWDRRVQVAKINVQVLGGIGWS